MSPEIWGMIAAILIPIGMMALRALTRERPPQVEVHGIEVFAGDRSGCRTKIELLADAGVLVWIEDRPDGGCAVMVDAEQAAQVPELLRRRDETPRSDGNGHATHADQPPLA